MDFFDYLTLTAFIFTVLALSSTTVQRINKAIHKFNESLMGSGSTLSPLAKNTFGDIKQVFVDANQLPGTLIEEKKLFISRRAEWLSGKEIDNVKLSDISQIMYSKKAAVIERLIISAYVATRCIFLKVYLFFAFLFFLTIILLIIKEVFGVGRGLLDLVGQGGAFFFIFSLFISISIIVFALILYVLSITLLFIERVLSVICYKEGWPVAIIGILLALPGIYDLGVKIIPKILSNFT
ncbi:hypothetical protein AADZ91_14795 [Colwelliaceae bacterium 6441]